MPLVVNGGNLKVSSVLLRCCVLETALECSLCENAISWRVASLIFLAKSWIRHLQSSQLCQIPVHINTWLSCSRPIPAPVRKKGLTFCMLPILLFFSTCIETTVYSIFLCKDGWAEKWKSKGSWHCSDSLLQVCHLKGSQPSKQNFPLKIDSTKWRVYSVGVSLNLIILIVGWFDGYFSSTVQ